MVVPPKLIVTLKFCHPAMNLNVGQGVSPALPPADNPPGEDWRDALPYFGSGMW